MSWPPPPPSQNCCRGDPRASTQPRALGVSEGSFHSAGCPLGSLSFPPSHQSVLPPPKKVGAEGRPPGFFFFLCPIPVSGNCHSHKTDMPAPSLHQLSLPSPPLLLGFYFWCDHGAFLWCVGKRGAPELIPEISGQEKYNNL